MAKKSKLKTPEWILEGYGSKKEYEKSKGISNSAKTEKTFKIKSCPECGSDEIGVVLTGEEEGNGEWECRKCRWKGRYVSEEELIEDKFMEYLDKKGEPVA